MFDPERWKSCTAFWFGPAGTVTPLHHDTCNILFVQLYVESYSGFTRQWRLTGWSTQYVRAIDPEAPDLAAYPNFANVQTREVVLTVMRFSCP